MEETVSEHIEIEVLATIGKMYMENPKLFQVCPGFCLQQRSMFQMLWMLGPKMVKRQWYDLYMNLCLVYSTQALFGWSLDGSLIEETYMCQSLLVDSNNMVYIWWILTWGNFHVLMLTCGFKRHGLYLMDPYLRKLLFANPYLCSQMFLNQPLYCLTQQLFSIRSFLGS